MSDRSTPYSAVPPDFLLSSYLYDLPAELIAQEPSDQRDGSRLLVLRKKKGLISHHLFQDLPNLLSDSDVLVLNETHVVPALLVGRKSTGGKVELLVLNPVISPKDSPDSEIVVRECLVKSSKPLRSGSRIILDGGTELTTERPVSPGRARVVFPSSEKEFQSFLKKYGTTPLPPYIRKRNRREERDRERYQTVYAKIPGSVAAPTAGLHFSHQLLRNLREKGITLAQVVLHVGPGTFLPVRDNDIRWHKMEQESYFIPEATADIIGRARRENRRIVAVGTTTVRALESSAQQNDVVRPGHGTSNLFIYPGYGFRVVQGLITNFHLPGSTLLMLVSAFASRDLILRGYRQALEARYRWYSYGDSCLII